MGRGGNSLENAREVLQALGIAWMTTNKIENNLWGKGVAFFGSSYCRVAYYDEVQSVPAINC